MKNLKENADDDYLRSLLHSFTEELSMNFLERRSRYNNHKSTVLDELQDVISELNLREKNLSTAVNIALMSIDNNEKLQKKLSSTKLKLMRALDKAHHQSIDIKSMQESLLSSEARYEQINKTLIETEEIMLINSAELNRIVRQRFTEPNNCASDEELDLIKKDFKTRLDAIQKKRWELEKENKQLAESKSSLEHEKNDLKASYESLELKYSRVIGALKESERQKDSFAEELEKLEVQFRILNSKYERLKLHSDRLEEELSIMEIKDTDQLEKKSLGHAVSLHSELEGIADDNEELEYRSIQTQGDESIEEVLFLKPNHQHSYTPVTRTSSLMSYFRVFSTCQGDGINISANRIQRKNPPEEYFLLVVQAVKMSSPHIESICTVPAQDLYKKAIKEGIPFHKWHVWVESQLNSAYVQQLYKKNSRNIWRRYGQKICL